MARCATVLIALLVLPAALVAQGGAWEIEVHGGRSLIDAPSGGMGSVPGPGTPFPTRTSLPSRRVSSWFLGDGAEFLNESLAALDLSQQIIALDSALNAPLAVRQAERSFGFRASRDLTSRFAAEFSLDVTSGVVQIAAPVAAGFQATSASFLPAFQALLQTGPFTDVRVSSTLTILDVDETQIVATGALRIDLLSRGRLIPYLTVGGGVITSSADAPTARLEGNYSFDISGLSPISETDHISLTHVVGDNVYIGLLGGGAEVFLTDRSGVRLDVRVHLGQNTIRTLVDANPRVMEEVRDPLSGAIASFRVPSIQFSNDPARGVSTLSGADIDEFEAFRVRGTQRHVAVSVGYFWRF
jgi:hypothetical protein